MSLLGLVVLTGLCKVFGPRPHAGTTLLPDDPRLHYTGRFDHTKPLAPTFSWTATQISTSFNGAHPPKSNHKMCHLPPIHAAVPITY